MAYCEDYPCCGHTLGECPDIDEDGNKYCLDCGKKLAADSPHLTLCKKCRRAELRQAYNAVEIW